MTAQAQTTALMMVLLVGVGTAAGQQAGAPRAGLTARQSEQAIKIATGTLRELREKAEDAKRPDIDKREFVVGVERLSDKAAAAVDEAAKAGAAPAKTAKALVTAYRYFDDTTVFAVIDLETGKTVKVETKQHLRTALSEQEYKEAQALAIVQSDEVKKLYERYRKRLEVYPQYSQYVPRNEDRVHRVVHLHYRVDGHDLSVPKPMVDLTTRRVEVRGPDE
jgi:hypothetical protein